MQIPLQHPTESIRQAVVDRLGLLDTVADQVLDGLVRTAAAITGCPSGYFNVIDRDLQWPKTSAGMTGEPVPRNTAFCAHTILHDSDILEVPDALQDARFATNPHVLGEPYVRFYAGVPIAVSGQNIGALCVVDYIPKTLSTEQRRALEDLGQAVQHWINGEEQRQQLQKADRYGRALFEGLGDAALLIDEDHRIAEANHAAVRLFEYPSKILMGMGLWQLVDQCDRLLPPLGARHSAQSGQQVLRKWSCISSTKRRFHAEIVTSLVQGQRVLATFRDVTERELRDERFRLLYLAVEQSADSVISTDLAKRIVYANTASLALTGYTRDELVGQDALLLSSDLDSFASVVPYAQVDNGVGWKGLLTVRRKDGSHYVQSALLSALHDASGEITHYVLTMKDERTEREMASELATYRERLEDLVDQRTAELAEAVLAARRASEAKSGFLATMSHEIRTPMNGVVGVIDVLMRSALDTDQRDLVETMKDSAATLLGIIDDILDFSKIEAGRLTIEAESVDLVSLVESVCLGIDPLAAARHVDIDVFVDPALPSHVSTDPIRVQQILNNLLSNAIKFSSGPGRSGRISVRALLTSGHLSLVVTDNGIGVAADALSRIFDPFEQAETSTTRSFGGTGLGLSICKRLSELMDGSIRIDSEAGRGACLTVTLPIIKVEEQPSVTFDHGLDGLFCSIFARNGNAGADWAAYLGNAGARVQVVDGMQALRYSLEANPVSRSVAIIDARDFEHRSGELDGLQASGSLVLVSITRGQLREPRMLANGSVVLESRIVLRHSLVEAVAMAVGLRVAKVAERFPRFGPRALPTADEAAAARQLILVAEDNLINQKVILKQLGILGFVADVAGNGQDALDAWRTGRYSLLLTDLHMPTMDGYALAEAIRHEENGEARMPIVALTANALRGEAKRAQTAGMDECMTKPVRLEALERVLTRFLAAANGDDGLVPEQEPASLQPAIDAEGVLDPEVLKRLIGDDPVVISEFIEEFVVSMNGAAGELRLASRTKNWKGVVDVAHRLKASAHSVGADALGRACAAIEDADFPDGREIAVLLLDAFEEAVARVQRHLHGDHDGSGEPQVSAPQAEPGSRPIGVVILDDEPLFIEAMRQQLRRQGIDPLMTWTEGRDALDWLRNRETSGLLILLDLHMARMDGIDFMRRLAEQGYLGGLAIISSADSRVLQTATKLAAAQRLSVFGHFGKPLTDRQLTDLIGSWRGFSPAVTDGAARKYSANEVLEAIIGNQLVLHYQPKIALRDGSVKGLEALVRWNHPVDGLVGPGAFIAVVEANGAIDLLTGTVVSQALAQARTWEDEGFSQSIAINVSMDNLLRFDFPELLRAEAARHRIPLTGIRLEVTESRLMSDLRSQVGSLTRLKLQGVGLSIDDFGTGHSSLSQLRDIPFDELKIDQSFVHGSATDPTRRAIFTASLGMAHDLGMTAVAEGVENEADWNLVRTSGVDLAQGYFIARPMPAESLRDWSLDWTERVKALL